MYLDSVLTSILLVSMVSTLSTLSLFPGNASMVGLALWKKKGKRRKLWWSVEGGWRPILRKKRFDWLLDFTFGKAFPLLLYRLSNWIGSFRPKIGSNNQRKEKSNILSFKMSFKSNWYRYEYASLLTENRSGDPEFLRQDQDRGRLRPRRNANIRLECLCDSWVILSRDASSS